MFSIGFQFQEKEEKDRIVMCIRCLLRQLEHHDIYEQPELRMVIVEGEDVECDLCDKKLSYRLSKKPEEVAVEVQRRCRECGGCEIDAKNRHRGWCKSFGGLLDPDDVVPEGCTGWSRRNDAGDEGKKEEKKP